VAGEVWSTMSNLVVNNERKREVCDETSLSFGKTRALRRIVDHPLSMGELATVLGMDPPNVTTMIDDLQRTGLVQRQPHPTDRRVMLVVITAAGAKVAQRAQEILDRPPEGLVGLPIVDLEELRRILSQLR
jgi:DNA-binding MarR family transcriptional regulator